MKEKTFKKKTIFYQMLYSVTYQFNEEKILPHIRRAATFFNEAGWQNVIKVENDVINAFLIVVTQRVFIFNTIYQEISDLHEQLAGIPWLKDAIESGDLQITRLTPFEFELSDFQASPNQGAE